MEFKEFKNKEDFYKYVEITDYLINLFRRKDKENEKIDYMYINYLKHRVNIINKSKYAECNYKYKGINC